MVERKPFKETIKPKERKPSLKILGPIFKAVDEFILGTDKTTKLAPHILDGIDIKRYMSFVILALSPCIIAGIYFWGLRVLAVIAVSYMFGGITEIVFSILRRKPLYEGFLVTGLIFALILPPTIPLWMVALGITFGVFFGKEVFGGTGKNIFNPALVGRIFLSLAFPEYFTTMWQHPLSGGLAGFVRFAPQAITSATPLINFKATGTFTNYLPLLIGTTAGSIGETFRLGILLGGILLIFVKIADWRIPLSYLLSVVVFSFCGNLLISETIAPPLFQILTGGLLFGAFFMVTDPVTSPLTLEGRWIYGFLLGIFTVLIRGFSGFAEGVMFAILLMNGAAPFIDHIIINLKLKRVAT